ncbi:MAG: DUF3325 domain-containing protein [Bacteroidota bacterium]
MIRDGALLLAGFALAYIGCALLALTLDRNWRKVTDATPPTSWTLPRVAGYGLIALAIVPLLVRDEVSFAILSWILWIGATSWAVALTLAWREGWLRPLADVLAVGAPAAQPAGRAAPSRPGPPAPRPAGAGPPGVRPPGPPGPPTPRPPSAGPPLGRPPSAGPPPARPPSSPPGPPTPRPPSAGQSPGRPPGAPPSPPRPPSAESPPPGPPRPPGAPPE